MPESVVNFFCMFISIMMVIGRWCCGKEIALKKKNKDYIIKMNQCLLYYNTIIIVGFLPFFNLIDIVAE